MDGEAQEAAAAVSSAGSTEAGLEEPSSSKMFRAEIIYRHQKEIKELQNREIAMKKTAAKGSKAEQKAKKKQVEEDILKLQTKMQARHAKELSDLGLDKLESGTSVDGLAKAFGGISTSGTQPPKPTKAQKRRDKKAQQEAEREQRIEQEQTNIVSERVVENQLLEGKLRPLGLTLKEIKPDGHCLYRAVEDQLALYPGACLQFSFQQLREVAAAYMRSHTEDFAPFVVSEGDADVVESPEGRFERYCDEVETTATWGGQLELDALSHSLQKHIVIFSSDLPEVEMGKQYEKQAANGVTLNPTLRLSYHRHAYGLGEHYNSVVPLSS